MNRNLWRAWLAGMVSVAGLAIAQPPPPPEGGGRDEMRAPPPGDMGGPGESRDVLRERLSRRLEDTKRMQERLESALKQLDGGTPPEQVREGLRREAREMLGGRPGGEGLRRPGGGEGNRFRQQDGARPDGPRGEGQAMRRGPDGGPQGGPEGGGPGGRPPLMDRPRIMELIEKHNPEFARMLRGLERDNPRSAERVWQQLEPGIRELIVENDPALQEVRIAEMKNGWSTLGKVRELHEAMRRGAPASEIDAKTSEIRGLFAERYDLQVKLHAADIARLERRLAQLREEAGRAAGSGKEKFVQERVDEMLARVKERMEREKNRRGDRPPADERGPDKKD